MMGRIMLVVVCSVLFASCASWKAVKVYPGMNVANEIIVRPELKKLTAGHIQNVKVVLRVPEAPKYLTQETQQDMNRLYDWFERELAKAGFIVRDRSLLEKVLSEDKTASYTGISQSIDTDLIIEILYMGPCDLTHNRYFDIDDCMVKEMCIPPPDKKLPGPTKFIMKGGRLDCRIITVKDATVSGMFTLYNLPSEGICDFEVHHNKICRNGGTNPSKINGFDVGGDEQNIRALATLLVQSLQEGDVSIIGIKHGGLAERYRFKPNDVIVKVNGKPAGTVPQTIESIMRADGKLDLIIRRDNQEIPITVSKLYAEPLDMRLKYRFVPHPQLITSAPENKSNVAVVASSEPLTVQTSTATVSGVSQPAATKKVAVKKKKSTALLSSKTTFIADYKNQS
jgi:hypothetical protein